MQNHLPHEVQHLAVQRAVRQVAQFVALRDVAGNPTALAAKLLQEQADKYIQ